MASAMERRKLGSTGLEVSPVAYGAGGVKSDEAAKEVVAAFVKGGVNFFDTSPAYAGGHSESRLGSALSDYPRESYVLQTKMGDNGEQNDGHSPFSRAGVLASVRHSLEVLKTPFVDNLLLHDPYADELETFLGKGGGMEAVHELKSQGVVKHFGCGAREHEPHLRLLEACPADFAICQTVDDENPLRRFLDQLELRAKCNAAGVAIINAAPLYRGLLVDAPVAYHAVGATTQSAPAHRNVLGEHSSSHAELAEVAEAMAEWTGARGVSLLHTAVQWSLKAPDVVSSAYGCADAKQVGQILHATNTPLPEGTFEAFGAEFDDRVNALGPEKHFYWFKAQSASSKEWKEMEAYPRATWGKALYAGTTGAA